MTIFIYIEFIKKYRRGLLGLMSLFILCTGLALILLPKKYKSVGVISISTRYFQNPLIKEFVSETYDNQEIRSQRESLLVGAITDEFVDSLADTYQLYSTKMIKNTPIHYYERSLLRKRIEIFSVNTSSSQISFVGQRPEMVQGIVNDIISRIAESLKSQRHEYLVNLRQSIKKRIDVIRANVDFAVDINAIEGDSPDLKVLVAEKEKLHNDLIENQKVFSDAHPQIIRLKKRLEALTRELASKGIQESREASKALSDVDNSNNFSLSDSQNLSKVRNVVYEDLVRKYEYLNIVIGSEEPASYKYISVLQNPSYPIGPIFPNSMLFTLWGLLGFVVSGFFYVVIREAIASRDHHTNEKEMQIAALNTFTSGSTPNKPLGALRESEIDFFEKGDSSKSIGSNPPSLEP